jgi:hypothetical protein
MLRLARGRKSAYVLLAFGSSGDSQRATSDPVAESLGLSRPAHTVLLRYQAREVWTNCSVAF